MSDRLDAEQVLADAVAQAGSDDLGAATWQEGYERLLASLRTEAALSELGVEVARAELVGYLANRAALTAWRQAHPAETSGAITRPIFIVGQPRTGTTILFDLLAQDPAFRVPLTWEVDKPVPPPETATYDSDPRIDVAQASLDMAESLMPGFTTFHPMGARLGQECVRITGHDFRSMIFPTQYHVPTYNRWLLHEADLGPAYTWHRSFLQHLQSRHPGDQWLLKSPAHLWHLDDLAREYPDAVVVQTHRDPLVVVASVSALVTHLRRLASDAGTLEQAAHSYADDIFVGLERGMAARERGVLPPEQVVDVQFSSFVKDPLATIGALYDALGRPLTAEVEARMRAFLTAHPGDGGGAGKRYRFSDTGLDADPLRARAKDYQDRYAVATETLT
ncbi:MAG TPA: sulfotransferase [Mycobacteriales bacterium]|nr:sulfotransferase [Mycobacteriales bacterium]